MMRSWNAKLLLFVAVALAPAYAQRPVGPARVAGQTCVTVTQANADASAGPANINHDGTLIAGTPAPDISRGFNGIPRSAQPQLTASQQRISSARTAFPDKDHDFWIRRGAAQMEKSVTILPQSPSIPKPAAD